MIFAWTDLHGIRGSHEIDAGICKYENVQSNNLLHKIDVILYTLPQHIMIIKPISIIC